MPPTLLLVSAATPGLLLDSVTTLASHLRAHPTLDPAAIAATLMLDRPTLASRLAVLHRPGEDPAARLAAAAAALRGIPARDIWAGEADTIPPDPEATTVHAELLRAERLGALAALWVAGEAIDWPALLGTPARVTLPHAPSRAVPMGPPAAPGKPASFWLHGATGDVGWVVQFARALGPGLASYGLEAPGLDGTVPPLGTIEALAAAHAAAIGRTHPDGPLTIGGYSAGGAIAFETAHLLLRQGRAVTRLVLIDAPAPGNPAVAVMQATYGAGQIYLVAGNWMARNWGAGGLTAAMLAGLDKTAMLDRVVAHLHPVAPSPEALIEVRERLLVLDAVGWAIGAALRTYRGRPLDIPVDTLLVACRQGMRGRDNPFGLPDCPEAETYREGWEALLPGPTHTLDLDCDHFHAVAEPFVRQIATAVLTPREARLRPRP